MGSRKARAGRQSSELLDDLGLAYFDHVLARYHLFKTGREIPEYIERIVDRRNRQANQLTWKDVHVLKEFVLGLQPDNVVEVGVRSPEDSEELTAEAAASRVDLGLPAPLETQRRLNALSPAWVKAVQETNLSMKWWAKFRGLARDAGWVLIILSALVPLGWLAFSGGHHLIVAGLLVAVLAAAGCIWSLKPAAKEHHVLQLLDDFGPAYFDHVIAQFNWFRIGKVIPTYIQEIVDRHNYEPEQLTWKDLYALEEFVLEIQPDAVVEARKLSLEENFKEVAGTEAYSAYLKLPASKGPGGLRSILSRLLDRLHWTYSMIPEREQMRTAIVRQAARWLLLIGVVLAPLACVAYLEGEEFSAMVLMVPVMGAVGGFLSLQRRIQNIPDRNPLLTMLELQNGRFTVALAPLTGAIFAIVLFLMFMGGLVTGQLFPPSIETFTNSLKPGLIGKVLLWSFIAGFAERFVPDTLDKITATATAKKDAKSVTTSDPGQTLGEGQSSGKTRNTGSRR